MEAFHEAVTRKVVSVYVVPSDKRDAIVVVSEQNFTYLIADDRFLLPGQNQIVAEFPNGNISDCIYYRSNNGIVGILCHHPGQRPNVEEMEFFEGNIDKYDPVHTYSRQSAHQALTPGGVTSLLRGGFNHDCSAHYLTYYGSPVINNGGRLVGMCFKSWKCNSAYNIDTICARMMENHSRRHRDVQSTVQFLRSLCA